LLLPHWILIDLSKGATVIDSRDEEACLWSQIATPPENDYRPYPAHPKQGIPVAHGRK